MFKSLLITCSLILTAAVYSQVELKYYLPQDISYNKDIPTPSAFIGHEVGEWHVTHDKLYYYMLELARLSDRAIWEEYGRSYENRPLGQLIISSPENIKNIEQLRQDHIRLCDPELSKDIDISGMPVIIKMGYGVHGNESSAQNASLLVAYYLVAGQGEKLDEALRNAIILIDPSLNPDGMQRHSSWVNHTRSLNNNPDVNSWEFSETWPGGRTNHYFFDLNRDYLMLQHPESVGRVRAFYRWRPNINNDHHEMGPDLTFFFQPGIQSRNNSLVPYDVQTTTAEIAKYHEKYLNNIGSLYYTEESYDDFYIGKGSAYPDIHGSIGILFEQAGTKGHLRQTPGGLLTFPFAIRNQFNVSLSSLEAGLNMRTRLLESQRKFYREALNEATRHNVKAYVFSEPSDRARVNHFLSNLFENHIKVYSLAKDVIKDGYTYRKGSSYVVPLKQNEYRYIRSLFETITQFDDSTFYDISTWTLPLSFNIPYAGISDKEMAGLTGSEITALPASSGELTGTEGSIAYLFEWKEYYTPKALYKIQSAGLKARVSTEGFTNDDGVVKRSFTAGTIMVPAFGQNMQPAEIHTFLSKIARDCGITIYGVRTGLTPQGIDLGSTKFIVLSRPEILMISGDGINSSESGEIWHLLDARFGIPVTMTPSVRMASVDLARYNVIIIAGSPNLGTTVVDNLRSWNQRGGTIIGFGSGNRWLERNKLATIEFVPDAQSPKKDGIYGEKYNDGGPQLIPGSIFQASMDLTHPLCFGYERALLPVFKSNATAAQKDKNIYNNPVILTDKPLLSGYCTKLNEERIKNTPFVSVHGNRVISIYDNTNFRAIWFGTNKIFMNAIFFGQIIK